MKPDNPAAACFMRSYADEATPPPRLETTIPAGAGFDIRVLARVIDLLFGLLVGFVGGIIGGFVLAILGRGGHVPADWLKLILQEKMLGYAFGLFGALLNQILAEGIAGTSVGKLLCGLSVVQLDGSPCSLDSATKRSLAYYVDGLFFGLVGYQSMKTSVLRQRFGDVWADTVVVKKSDFVPTPKPDAERIAVGILLGAIAWMLLRILGWYIAAII